MTVNEWKPILKILPDDRPEYTTAGFDWGTQYQFRRGGDGDTWVGRAVEWPDYFNIEGLWFRELAHGEALAEE